MIEANEGKTHLEGDMITLMAELTTIYNRMEEISEMPDGMFDSVFQKSKQFMKLKDAGMSNDEIAEIITGKTLKEIKG